MDLGSLLESYVAVKEVARRVPEEEYPFAKDNPLGTVFLIAYDAAAQESAEKETGVEIMEHILEMTRPSNYEAMKGLYDSLDL